MDGHACDVINDYIHTLRAGPELLVKRIVPKKFIFTKPAPSVPPGATLLVKELRNGEKISVISEPHGCMVMFTS